MIICDCLWSVLRGKGLVDVKEKQTNKKTKSILWFMDKQDQHHTETC